VILPKCSEGVSAAPRKNAPVSMAWAALSATRRNREAKTLNRERLATSVGWRSNGSLRAGGEAGGPAISIQRRRVLLDEMLPPVRFVQAQLNGSTGGQDQVNRRSSEPTRDRPFNPAGAQPTLWHGRRQSARADRPPLQPLNLLHVVEERNF
jgi:hypothetical protein